jgi:multicomponent Na+:H+ antiporter subunit A
MLAILVAHAVAAAVAPVLVRRWGRWAFYPLALAPLASLIWVSLNWPSSQHDHRVIVRWIPELSMDIALRFDSLAAIMSVLVLGVGALVLCYCAEYFHHHDGHTEHRLPSFAAELVAFSGMMFGLVVADNMLVLYVFWELTTVLSFLLIGHYAERLTSRRAATRALLVTTAGGLAMLTGIVILGHTAGSYLLSDLVAAPPSGVAVAVAVLLVLVGALSKSAIVPLHFWLPGAMAAPTPVSAYLHAAAMVKAGVYLIARMAPGFATSPGWRPTVVVLGLGTMVMAGWRAVREYDLKLILAFGTVSQLGLITVLVGIGDRDPMLAGLALLCGHAMFKAALFMVVGIIDHATGTRDIRRLAGLGRRCPSLLLIAAAAAASMAALPPFLGFVAKEAGMTTLLYSPSLGAAAPWALAVITAGSVFTMIYSLRFVWGAFARKGRRDPSSPVAGLHRPTAAFLTAPAILATAGLCLGLAPAGLDTLLRSYSGADPSRYHLALWHASAEVGALPLALSALITVLGVAAFFGRARLRRARLGWLPLGNADRAYNATIRGLDVLSVRLTAITQRGSIPTTQSVILSTLVLAPAVALMLGAGDRPELRLWGSPRQAILAGVLLTAALGATATRNRLAAVLMVGVTGYACGAVFAFHGAPDLALTQFLVETVTLVIFVLVLRTLPAEVDDIKQHRLPRMVLALAVGAAVTVLAVFAIAARTGASIASLLPDAAYHRGHGANTVNVLLVDIRAWDTLGEISVLLVAATGVASLVFRHRRFGLAPRIPQDGQVPDQPGQPHSEQSPPTPYSPAVGDTTWLRGSEYRDPRYRSLVLEVTTRIIFPLIMVVSVYFFFTGHNTPGGGFAGGLTAGLALVLRYLAGGRYELGETLPLDAGKILGVGLGLSVGTAAMSLLFGAPVLSSAVVEFDIPVLGHFTFVTGLFFDLGVYLIVVGLVLDVLRSVGARIDQELVDPATAREAQ